MVVGISLGALDYEIDFRIADLADIHVFVAALELEKDHILKDSARISYAAGKHHTSHAHIDAVIFLLQFQEALSSEVKALCRIKDIAVDKSRNVFRHSVRRDSDSLRSDEIAYGLGRSKVSHVVEQIGGKSIEALRIGDVQALRHVLEKHGAQDTLKVIVQAQRTICLRERTRHPSRGDVSIVEPLPRRACIRCTTELLERKGEHRHFHIAPRKQGGQRTPEHESVRARDVQVKIVARIKAVDRALELGDVLHLVYKHIVHFPRFCTSKHLIVQLVIVENMLVFQLLEIDDDDLIRIHSLGLKVLRIELEQR